MYKYEPSLGKVSYSCELSSPYGTHENTEVTCFAIHATKPYVLSAFSRGDIFLWHYGNSWEQKKRFYMGGGAEHVMFHPNNTIAFAATSGDELEVRVFLAMHFDKQYCRRSC
jgi:hypothetical protein